MLIYSEQWLWKWTSQIFLRWSPWDKSLSMYTAMGKYMKTLNKAEDSDSGCQSILFPLESTNRQVNFHEWLLPSWLANGLGDFDIDKDFLILGKTPRFQPLLLYILSYLTCKDNPICLDSFAPSVHPVPPGYIHCMGYNLDKRAQSWFSGLLSSIAWWLGDSHLVDSALPSCFS